ncbi:LysR family transcriptional regulator [Pseudomonas sp. NPDC090202]|uniref:LysR family transcriptional regulator n=1 Tax=unclassified Pseudomonas TaxID=196821 RepID=UPI003802063E
MLIEDLRALTVAIECASLTKAAEKLHLTQSAVSRRIQHLEEYLGATLFDRTSRPPLPTAMGLRVYESAVTLLRDAEQLRRIPQESATPSGKFRVGVTQVVADAVVLDTVTSIRKAFPQLEMQIATHWSFELEKLFDEGLLDAATLLRPAPSTLAAGMDGKRVATLEVLVLQSRAHPLTDSVSDLQRLAAHEWILNPKGCAYRSALETAMGRAGHTLRLGIDTHGATIQTRMIAAGLGLGLLPRRLYEQSPFRDELAIVEVADFSLHIDVWVAHPAQPGNLKQANELLIEQVMAGFADDGR